MCADEEIRQRSGSRPGAFAVLLKCLGSEKTGFKRQCQALYRESRDCIFEVFHPLIAHREFGENDHIDRRLSLMRNAIKLISRPLVPNW